MNDFHLALVGEVPIQDPVQVVFDHWVAVMRAKSAVRCVLNDKRRKVISRAINDYDVPTCLLAIDGCRLSDWHMGSNPRGRKYDDLELILRDAAHIERFANIAAEADAPSTDFTEISTEVDW